MRSLRLLVVALAAVAFTAWLPAALAQDRSAVVLQKLRLLEGLLRSPRATEIAAGADASAKALYEQVRRQFEDAKALHGTEPERAEPLLDAALRLISQASAKSGGGALAASQLRQHHADLLEQVQTYRRALAEALQRRDDEVLRTGLGALDRLSAEGAAHAQAGRLGDANKALAQAYQVAIAAVAKARAGETVVIDLKFATPADEYAYEQRRFRSSLTLVDMMLAEGRASGGLRSTVDGAAQQGRDAASRAEALAASAEHSAAIRVMEEATRHLTRALQLLGVQAF